MAQRQKFWSHATGFKMGRKLADWGKDAGEAPERKPEDQTEEDRHLQQAIALSLAEQGNTVVSAPTQVFKPQASEEVADELESAIALSLSQPELVVKDDPGKHSSNSGMRQALSDLADTTGALS